MPWVSGPARDLDIAPEGAAMQISFTLVTMPSDDEDLDYDEAAQKSLDLIYARAKREEDERYRS